MCVFLSNPNKLYTHLPTSARQIPILIILRMYSYHRLGFVMTQHRHKTLSRHEINFNDDDDVEYG